MVTGEAVAPRIVKVSPEITLFTTLPGCLIGMPFSLNSASVP
jgi:hypothetical protein